MRNNTIELPELLRSINIVFDADRPERVAHFQPTSKSLALFKYVLAFKTDRAFLVSAPYGTGKSLAHAYLLQVVENLERAQPVLKPIAQRVGRLDSELGTWLKDRTSDKDRDRGVVIALQGYQRNIAQALGEALSASMKRLKMETTFSKEKYSFESLTKAINSLQRFISDREKYEIDRIVIIWDEFGRHLENIIAEGQAANLYDLQTVAEFASRSQEMPITLSLLLHQSLMNYAGKVPQSIRREWKKIEGRFNTISYIDDSKEIYQFLGQIISNIRTIAPSKNRTGNWDRNRETSISEIRQLGMFADIQAVELTELLSRAYPLEPLAFCLLPKISSRVAQHERTLFTFLNTVALDRIIDLADLYDYFSPIHECRYHNWRDIPPMAGNGERHFKG